MKHEYVTVLARRWCVRCNTFQRFRSGRWRDEEEMIGPWPGYSRTTPECPSPPSPLACGPAPKHNEERT